MLTHLWPEPIRPERVVVMGAGGFVGRAIASRLARDGVAVLELSRRHVDLVDPGAAERLGSLLRPGDVFVAVSALVPCKTVEMLRDNIVMALAMAKAASSVALAQMLNVSSDAVYADGPTPLTEQSATAPDSLHGVMHLAREAMFRSEIKVPIAILRPTLIYGGGDPHNGYGPNRFRRLAAKGEPITLFGKGEERRDHILVDDVAELAARIIYRCSHGVLNAATGVVTSFRDIATMISALSGRPVVLHEAPRIGPVPHGGYRPFDITACRAAFPDFAFTPLAQGLAKVQQEANASASI